MAVNDEVMQTALAAGLEVVFNLIARYEIVERTFLHDAQSGVHKELEEGIVKLYAAILLYFFETYRLFTKSTVGRLASSVTASREGIDKIKSAESQVHDYMPLASHEVAHSTSRDVGAIATSVQQVMPILEGVNGISASMQDLNFQISQLSPELEGLHSILRDLDSPISRSR